MATTQERTPTGTTGSHPGSSKILGLDRGRAAAVLPAWAPTALRLLCIYAAVRIALLVADVLAAHIGYGGNLDGPFDAWDSHFYVQVAAHGYPAVSPHAGGHLTYSAAGFEPVFPALIRFFAALGLPLIGAGLVVSLVFGAASVVLVYLLASELTGEETAFRAAVLFCVFPGMGVPWGMLYSESVGVALVAGSLLMMARKRWFWAGVIGALATATSPMALPLAAAALVPTIQSLWRRERPGALIAVVMVPLGFVGFAAWLGVYYHDTLYWWHLQNQAWGATVDFGKSLVLLLPHFWSGGYQGKGWLEWTGLAAVVAGGFALWRARLPGFVNAYCGAVVVILLVSNQLGFKPRLLSWAFPALIAVAVVVRGRTWQALAIGFACLMPVVLIAYTTLGNTMIQP